MLSELAISCQLLSTGQDKKVLNYVDFCKAVHAALGGMRDRDSNSFVKYVGKLEYFANFRDMVENHLAYLSGINHWVQIALFQSYC